MTAPIYLKNSGKVGLVALIQLTLPAALVVLVLMGVTSYLNVVFDQYYRALAVLSGTLSLLVLRVPNNGQTPLMTHRASIVLQLLLRWVAIVLALLVAAHLTQFRTSFEREVMVAWMLLVPVSVIPAALLLQSVRRRMTMSQQNIRSAVVLGYTPHSQQLADKLQANPELCTSVLGFFDDRDPGRLGTLSEHKLLGALADLPDYVRTHKIDVIFIALPIRHLDRVMNLLDDLHDSTASIYYVPDVFVFDLIQSRSGDIVGTPVVSLCETPFYGFRGVLKRFTDLMFTLAGMVALLPVMILLALLIRITSRGPVIFKQRRYGLDGHEIVVYKFRSMYVAEDGEEIWQATRDDPRITPIGKILRRYSLDELPQFINVLQGRMSLVGPRPHAVAHNEQYRRLIKGYMMRHKVLPGITGLAQVNGCRGETRTLEDMEARVRYDLEYLRNWSPLLDLKILLLTVLRVFHDSKAY